MSYGAFLLVMSQLIGNRKARVVIQGNVIFFEKSKKNHWTLYTKVYSGDGYLPSSVRSCVSSNGVLRWQRSGAYLKLDPISHSVYLFEEIEIEEGKYIPFKHRLSDFSTVAAEWREILREFAESDCFSIPKKLEKLVF
jgi:hypothetical protein